MMILFRATLSWDVGFSGRFQVREFTSALCVLFVSSRFTSLGKEPFSFACSCIFVLAFFVSQRANICSPLAPSAVRYADYEGGSSTTAQTTKSTTTPTTTTTSERIDTNGNVFVAFFSHDYHYNNNNHNNYHYDDYNNTTHNHKTDNNHYKRHHHRATNRRLVGVESLEQLLENVRRLRCDDEIAKLSTTTLLVSVFLDKAMKDEEETLHRGDAQEFRSCGEARCPGDTTCVKFNFYDKPCGPFNTEVCSRYGCVQDYFLIDASNQSILSKRKRCREKNFKMLFSPRFETFRIG